MAVVYKVNITQGNASFNMMLVVYCLLVLTVKNIVCVDYELLEYCNRTDPATRQLVEFAKEHPKPVGILTTSSGKFVEIRESTTLNSDAWSNPYHVDLLTHTNAERIPQRMVHARGTAAIGYFEVTHDVSKYTKADVFNGIGKKTRVLGRFSSLVQSVGGNDLAREVKALATKFYTREGNLDFLSNHLPVFFIRDPLEFPILSHVLRKNPKTNILDYSIRWDFVTKVADMFHAFMWMLSDFGIPNGYRKMDVFPIHVFEINNKNGDKHFVKFNFRTLQGLENLPSDVAADISARDPDYYIRDLYNAIENKNYPAWELEMDVMTLEDIKNLNYNPFEVTRLWKKGTYHTVKIGRLVFNKNPDNMYRFSEESAFNPFNLVPGIPGPMDTLYRSRRASYRQTQVFRLGVNHNRMSVNAPLHWSVYDRDGLPPLKSNMRDAPNYYPNSFNGPVPYVDPSRPKQRFSVYEANAVDLESVNYFLNHYLDQEQRERLVNNTIATLIPVSPKLRRRVIRLFTLTDAELGKMLTYCLKRALKIPPPPPPHVLKAPSYTHEEL